MTLARTSAGFRPSERCPLVCPATSVETAAWRAGERRRRFRCVGLAILLMALLGVSILPEPTSGAQGTRLVAASDITSVEARVNQTTLLDRGGTGTDDKSNQLQERRRLLVHQLTDLIMNNEPAIIEANLEAAAATAPPSFAPGRLLSNSVDQDIEEVANLAIDESEEPDYELDAKASSSESTQHADALQSAANNNGPYEDGSSQTSASQEFVDAPLTDPQESQQQQQQQQLHNQLEPHGSTEELGAGQTVTCSPDYEDQAIIELASGNMTAEQQQQVLAGAGSSGLLNGSSGVNQSSGDTSEMQQMSSPMRPFGGQCVQPGSRMIEIITKIITPILFTIIIVVGLLGNIIVMLVILEDRKTDRELTPTNLLILDLSLADLSFIIFCIPFTGWDYAVGHWVFGPLWCKFNQYLIVVCALSSIYTLVLMSIDRFLAIVYPIECMSYRTSKNMLYAICIKWILILLTASPTVAMHGLIDSPLGPDQYNCRFLADQYNPLHFQIIFFITSYLFPLILIFCLYLSVLNKLWFGAKPRGHRESSKMLESKKKVTWLVAGIVIVFALCWCPIQVMLILMRLKSHRITATYVAIQVFSHILGYMNSCVNPIVYAFASETFTNSFKRSSLGRLCYMCFGIPKSHGSNGHHNNNHHTNTSHHPRVSQTTGAHDLERSTIFRPGNNETMSPTINSLNPNHKSSLNYVIEHNDQTGKSVNSIADNRFTTTSSTTTTNTTTSSSIGANTASMLTHGDEFEASNARGPGKVVTLPLEPRDRIVLPQLVQSSRIGPVETRATDDFKVPMQSSRDRSSNGSCASVTNQPSQNKMPPKQQLVARIDKSSNQIAHQCEPQTNNHNHGDHQNQLKQNYPQNEP